MDERTRVRELLADLEDTLAGLREKQGVTKQEYETDRDLQDIVERRLEKASQTCIDIGRRLCRLEGQDVSDGTNAEVFVTLVELGVLPESDRQEFVDIAGLLTSSHTGIDTSTPRRSTRVTTTSNGSNGSPKQCTSTCRTVRTSERRRQWSASWGLSSPPYCSTWSA